MKDLNSDPTSGVPDCEWGSENGGRGSAVQGAMLFIAVKDGVDNAVKAGFLVGVADVIHDGIEGVNGGLTIVGVVGAGVIG